MIILIVRVEVVEQESLGEQRRTNIVEFVERELRRAEKNKNCRSYMSR
jgi:hypothetical protein